MQAVAAVLDKPGGPLTLEELTLEAPRPTEVVVKLASVGICRSDLHAMTTTAGPVVLGHEGAGVVEAVGSAVTKVAPGDPVLMTFLSCGACERCLRAEVAYCERFNELNFSGTRADGTSALSRSGQVVSGHFLGQSCFATHCIAGERSVVRLPPGTDLRPLGPLGCGFQTGAGAVLNALRPPFGSSLAVFGAGAVGLASIAAAARCGCRPVVAIDTNPSRLDVAANLGATDAVDAASGDAEAQLRRIRPRGFDFALDTTGRADVMEQAVAALNTRGVCGVVGAGGDDRLTLDWRTVLNGRTVTGIIAGNSIPDLFLPQLVGEVQSGRLPLDRLITYYPFTDIAAAVEDAEAGRVVKPVLVFSE
ncbi:MAG: NAD(P)-dependent alcohol dehydrogenase [Acidimicrobiaceae bacterium]|nr:NAD(P)-dependent alcohol dehydrogenase [Acidimicrobiaceae bacterium]